MHSLTQIPPSAAATAAHNLRDQRIFPASLTAQQRLYEGLPPTPLGHPSAALVNGSVYPMPRLPLGAVMLNNPPNPSAVNPGLTQLPPHPVSPTASVSPPVTQTQPKKSFCIDALLAKNQTGHESQSPESVLSMKPSHLDDRLTAVGLQYAREMSAAAAAGGMSEQEALQRIHESREYDSPSPDGMSR